MADTDEKPAAKHAPAEVAVLDVVEYCHRDPILGGERRQLGVVVAVDGQAVDVVPLEGYRVRTTVDDVTRLDVDAV
jgi:hypothetical protein